MTIPIPTAVIQVLELLRKYGEQTAAGGEPHFPAEAQKIVDKWRSHGRALRP